MPDTEAERAAISKAYFSTDWEKKVAKMSPAQVHAVYMRFKAQKKI